MKIALLNLPVDNNYGGNLQRYALMKVLQDLGHDVTHIALRYKRNLPWYKKPYSYPKRFILKYFFHKKIHINEEAYLNKQDKEKLKTILPFYDKYIKHTRFCYSIRDFVRETRGKFDAYVVGSDQVWRKSMCLPIGWRNFLLEFAAEENVKRFAYAISFGIDSTEYDEEEYSEFRELFSYFNHVSVRENTAVDILNAMGCNTSHVSLCLDPTLLLDRLEWVKLCSDVNPSKLTKGKIFCYVLDMTEEIKKLIKQKSEELILPVVVAGLSSTTLSITDWLSSIYDAEFVITDSYHGIVFSIIFGKQFLYCGNKRRGNSRIESLFEIIGISCNNNQDIDWNSVNRNISYHKKISIEVLNSY